VSDYALAYGTHASPADGRCAMEWVSHLAGESHSDQPECVSPVLRTFCIALNDGLEDEPRQRLRPYLSRTIGTAGDGQDPRRAWMALDWLIRTFTPAWLALADETATALVLAALAPVTDPASLDAALAPLGRARAQLRAVRSPVSVRRPAPGVPWDAVRGAARETAWSCAGAAAWSAARLAIGESAGDRARALAQSVAGDAAAAAARAALARDPVTGGRSAHRAATRAVLGPTLSALRVSALELLERMLPLETVEIPALVPVFTTS
jgi:hypothetical protein